MVRGSKTSVKQVGPADFAFWREGLAGAGQRCRAEGEGFQCSVLKYLEPVENDVRWVR